MNRLFRALLMLSIAIFFFQCQKDLSYIGGPDLGGLGRQIITGASFQ
jgi:hypothetical protein